MKTILLTLLCLLYFNFQYAQGWGQIQKLVASDRAASNEFGTSVSIDGNYMVVGSPFDALGSIAKGSVYIFKKDGTGNWAEHQKLLHPGSNAYDTFGGDVDISGDYLIAGSRGQSYDSNNANYRLAAGASYIFERDGANTWSFIQKLVAPDRDTEDVFGESVAIDSNYAVVAAPWEDDDVNNNNTIPYSGSAYIFERDGSGSWNFTQKITAPVRAENDRFGKDGSVAIQGDYIFVGAAQEDEDENDENTISGAGSVYVFKRDAMGSWIQVQKLVASDRAAGDNFGWSVNANGNYLIVGAPFEDLNSGDNFGAVYIFERSGEVYTEVQKVVASSRGINDRYGYSVDISNNIAIIGAFNRGILGTSFAGAVYILEKSVLEVWEEAQYNYALDFATTDRFGFDVGVSGDFAIAGAYQEDEDELDENTIAQAGSVYVFKANEPNTLSAIDGEIINVKVFPNPAQHFLNLKLDKFYGSTDLKLYNYQGQVVMDHKFSNLDQIELGVQELCGIFVMKVVLDNNASIIKKVIINN